MKLMSLQLVVFQRVFEAVGIQRHGVFAVRVQRLERFYSIDLMCDPELQPFYERFGLKPYTGMVKRNFERQNGKVK